MDGWGKGRLGQWMRFIYKSYTNHTEIIYKSYTNHMHIKYIDISFIIIIIIRMLVTSLEPAACPLVPHNDQPCQTRNGPKDRDSPSPNLEPPTEPTPFNLPYNQKPNCKRNELRLKIQALEEPAGSLVRPPLDRRLGLDVPVLGGPFVPFQLLPLRTQYQNPGKAKGSG